MSIVSTFCRSRLWKTNVNQVIKVLSNTYKLHNNYNLAANQQIRLLSDLRYSDKHEWVSLDSTKKVGTVGISKYAEEALGDVVYVQLPDVDTSYDQNDEVGAVESVKAASEIFTPVSGRIVQINEKLEDKPGMVNTSCYDEGWLFKIELSKPQEIDKLMDEQSYQKFLESIREE
ncbi:glycine cleavage system H protein, mitochondrial-like [Oppia nitens]|uniref:glycine cleavage system H protein, mitochondrial-like n=1 Tax=Oppia nitens TaxID=1686743 RepID=UPI0023DCB2B7|nr:glycine cleavage system H protein, mitochondrial-like [Oppia nitens]